MKTLIATLTIASIFATSMVAVARDNSASPNDPYVTPQAAIPPADRASVLPFTWTEKRAFDRAIGSSKL